MGEYHRISGMVEAGLMDRLNPSLDDSQRRGLKALSSLRAAIKPPPGLMTALDISWERVQSTLARVHGSIKLAEGAVKAKDDDALGVQGKSIREELAGMVKFLSMAKALSAHNVISDYSSAVSSGMRFLLPTNEMALAACRITRIVTPGIEPGTSVV